MEEKTIKLVFLCRDFGKVNRGVEAHVKELTERLKKSFSIEIFSGADADNLNKVLRGKFDLVIPTNGRFQAFIVSLGRLMGGYKTLIAAHAGVGKDEIWNLLTLPNVYVALTDYELSWAKNFAINSRLVKIPNGIDLGKFKPSGEKNNFNLEKPIILSVGALEWYKHHDLAIRAVAELPEASLLIVGEGSEREKLTELGNKLLGERRFSIIKSEYEQMPQIYTSADLFTLPSWDREAFGIVYLEAMASGLAVVASNDLSRQEIIGDAGILTDPFNGKKYSESLKVALEKKWGDLPRKQAEKFSWEKISEEYEKIIIQICR